MMLLETIKCKEGELLNLTFHQKRLELAFDRHFPESEKPILSEIVRVPQEFREGLFRCRVVYSDKIEKIEFLPHEFRKINSLRLVQDDSIDYPYKYADRRSLGVLFAKRQDCDEILIVKNNCITDSYTANPVFFDGQSWWAPDVPLLPGTQRARLLEEGVISECRITVSDLPRFQKVGLVNALQDMNDMPVVPIENIVGIETLQ
jgi:4-amino-4-deoxychorismate lyase